jgi:N,N'-diacetyllegionaminate synthase
MNKIVKIEYIAEIGWNFMGDMKLAESMIAAAADSGATTAKFQYWNPDKLKPGPWDDDGRREIYQKAKLNKDKISLLSQYCKEHGVNFLLSVFNREDLEFVSEFSTKAIKVPSHEVSNLDLIKTALNQFSRVHLSLGACTEKELDNVARLVKELRPNDKDVTAMHCVSSYPCDAQHINLPRLDKISEIFSNSLGLSDHSQSALIPALALAKGATVIEKHFTTDRDLPGRDNKFAMLPKMFEEMVGHCEEAKQATTDHGIGAQASEHDTMTNYRGRWG